MPTKTRTFIREWREYRGLTVSPLAEKASMSDSRLSMLERGEKSYTHGSLEVLATALKTDAAALVTLNPSGPEAVWSWLGKFGGK
jgi:transcriptional regulator with XRE-family HTH domain